MGRAFILLIYAGRNTIMYMRPTVYFEQVVLVLSEGGNPMKVEPKTVVFAAELTAGISLAISAVVRHHYNLGPGVFGALIKHSP